MRRLLIALVLLAACGSPEVAETLPTATTAALPDDATSPTVAPPPAVEACDPAPFVPTLVPDRVAADLPATQS